MLDLDRVVMILPQVHLRNGEMTAGVDLHTRSTRPRGACPRRSPVPHFRGAFLALGAAFAGAGLNIKRGQRAVVGARWLTHPIPYSLLTFAI